MLKSPIFALENWEKSISKLTPTLEMLKISMSYHGSYWEGPVLKISSHKHAWLKSYPCQKAKKWHFEKCETFSRQYNNTIKISKNIVIMFKKMHH